MRRPHSFLPALVLLGLALPVAVHAQTQPAQGVLRAPSHTAPARPQPLAPPPKASPVAPVQQVAPFSSAVVHPSATALGHSAPGHAAKHPVARRTPVVRPPRQPQARKAKLPPAKAAVVGAVTAGAVAAVVKPTVPAPSAAPSAAPPAPERPPIDPNKGTVTGMVLPRWVALRSADVNMRTGPGTRYPVEWQYHRRNLPVKLEREFEVWRLVEDQDGIKGWVHQANLTSQRGFVLKGVEQILRNNPSDTASPVALLKPGVLGRIIACKAEAAWCEVRAGGYGGWLKRAVLWGLFADETVTN